MGAIVGRQVIVKKGAGGTVVSAGRTKSLTLNAEPIDITSDDDSGFRTLLETEAGNKSVDMSFEGISKDSTFISAIANGNYADDYDIEITGIGTVSARFVITSVAINAAYNEAVTFSAEFQSSGTYTFV